MPTPHDLQYKEDYRLPHFVISDVWHFNNDDDRFLPASIELFGYSAEIIDYKDGQPYENHKATIEKGSKLHYRIVKIEGEIIIIDQTLCGKLRLSKENFLKLKTYFDKKNTAFIALEGELSNDVKTMLPKLMEDSELVQMVLNLIDEMPQIIFLDPNFIISLESLILIKSNLMAHSGNYGDSLLLSNELQRGAIYKLEQIPKEISANNTSKQEFEHVENENIINPFLDDSFFLLVKLIINRFSPLDIVVGIYLTYTFFYKVVIRYFSQKWSSEYSNYFGNISDINFKKRFSNIF